MMFLSEDMIEYYVAYETYIEDNTTSNYLEMTNKLRQLHFSIKHRAVEGEYPQYVMYEMWDYFERFDIPEPRDRGEYLRKIYLY